MAGYSDTRKLIIDTLMGRPAGTEIKPEDHQAFVLALNDYIRNVELNSGNAFIGFAQSDTVPIQSNNGQCFYISTVPPGTNIVYANFIDYEGNPISVTTPPNKMAFVTLIWNTRNWDSQITIIETNWSQIFENNIAPNSIDSSKIIDGTIQSTDLNPNAFDNTLTKPDKIAPADVVGSKLTELLNYINGMEGGVNGFAEDTSFQPNYPEDVAATVIGVGPGTFTNMIGENGSAITVDSISVVIFFKAAGSTYWKYKTILPTVVIEGNVELGVKDYAQLQGKPFINGKELASGENTLDELGIQPKGDYTTASQLAATLENYASKAAVDTLQALIPATATADNQLADKDFVNSSIATATAEFKGSFTSLDELKATSGNLNDYAFYLHTDNIGNKVVDRYKWTTAGWLYEYTLNNSSFTAEQWAALNSAITATLVQSYNNHLNNSIIHITAEERTKWNNKWDYNEETIKAVKVNAAVSADKLATANEGTSAIPIYFKNGKPAQCIPSDLFSGFANAYSSTGERSLGITIAGHTKMVVVAYSTLAGSADKLATARKIWGRLFDGLADVSGDLEDVRNISASGKATIQGDIVCGGEVVAITGEGTPAGVTDYSALTGKPQINGVTLVSGNNTLASLGIQAAGDYATNSGVNTLLADYTTKTFVSNNYAGKSAFNAHIADTNIHITAAERDDWNAKWDYDEATIKAVKVTSASSADSVAWANITNKPSTFTPSAHTHAASEINGLPTSLKNPYKLTFGSKTYDGSAAATITASDLGALTAHQSIYALTLQVNGTSKGVYNPASAAKTINIAVPTKTSDITNDSGFITSAAIPTALKNPYAVEIKANGVSLGTYDGSEAATFNLSAANVGAANRVHSHTASEISGLPTNLSAFTNDVGYITGITKSMVEGVLTGNIASHTHSYLPLSGGNMANNAGISWTYNIHSWDNAVDGLECISVLSEALGYYSGISYKGHYGLQIRAYGGDTDHIEVRGNNHSSWGTWRRLLHSGNYNSYAPTLTGTGASGTWDINISGNAASATKLQTPRTIWGRNFDGSGNIWGGIDVNGYMKTNSITKVADLGTVGLVINASSVRNNWGMCFWTEGNGRGMIQQQAFDAAAATYPICLQPFGGNTLIGTTTDLNDRLQVYQAIGIQPIDGRYSGMFFYMNTGTKKSWHISARGGEPNEPFRLYYSPDKSTFNTILDITKGGNILIGTTTDNGYKLQVAGSERVYGDLIVDGEVSALVA